MMDGWMGETDESRRALVDASRKSARPSSAARTDTRTNARPSVAGGGRGKETARDVRRARRVVTEEEVVREDDARR